MLTGILSQFNSSSLVHSSNIVSATFFFLPAYLFLKVIYRLWFHPLSKFPGPTLKQLQVPAHELYFRVIQEVD